MRSPVTMPSTQRGQLPRLTIPTSPALPWETGQQGPRRGAQRPWLPRRAPRRCWDRQRHRALVRCRGRGGAAGAGGARAGGEACGQAVAFAHVPWPSPRPGPGWGRHRLSRRRRSPFLEGALRPRPQLGEVPTPVSLPRSVLCDDVATRSVARRKPALHRPQDSPLLAVSNPRVFSVTASGLQPRHVSCDSSPRTPVSFCLGLHWQEVRSAADDSG